MQAIILAAGMGKRLKELTENNTKCMVKVNGVTLIERMLRQIESKNLSRIVIVIGYEGQKLKDYISTLSIRTPIVYEENPVYNKTNNIYSLYLAREWLLKEDTILFESDLIFEDSVLDVLLEDPRESLALVDKYESWMDGTCVKLGENDTIEAFIPGSKFKYSEIREYYKTVNIYKFSRHFSETHYVPFLDAYQTALGKNEYYEQVLRIIAMLDDPEIRVKRLEGQIWYEIDDIQDLDIAESLFAPDQERASLLCRRYGGYWRYPKMLNFCDTGNPYFPPEKMKDELRENLGRVVTAYPSGAEVNSLLAAKNLGVKAEHTAVANGMEELIKSIMSLHPKDEAVGVVRPVNEEYISRLSSERIVVYTPEEKDLHISLEDVRKRFESSGIGLLILPNPNTHTGEYQKKSSVCEFLDWAKDAGIRVLIDESYVDFAPEIDGSMLEDRTYLNYRNLIVLRNLSVAQGLFGLRIGCAVSANEEEIRKIRKDLTIWNINSIAEFYLQIAEKYAKAFRASVEDTCRARRTLAEDLRGVSGLEVYDSSTDFLLVKITKKDYTAKRLLEELLVRYNILVKDTTDRIPGDGSYLRIAVRKKEENGILVSALKELLGEEKTADRLVGEGYTIDDLRTKDFFDERTKKQLPHRYNYVIYQDSNPELAMERDRYEKEKMLPFMNVREDSVILDIGCGVGRWADEFVKYLENGRYIGADYSQGFLDVANEALSHTGKCTFLNGSFQELSALLEKQGLPGREGYDLVLINGVLMYLNDDDIEGCLADTANFLKRGGRVYIKESVGIEKRFTLKDFYSKELTHNYNAIYRSIDEYKEMFGRIFPDTTFTVVSCGDTWKREQENRSETSSYYWIIGKKQEEESR